MDAKCTAVNGVAGGWRRGATVLAGIAGGIALEGLLGWIFDIDLMRSVVPGLSMMKANTAIWIGAAAAVLLLEPHIRTMRWRRMLSLLPAAILALGLATLYEYAAGRSLGIDTLLFADPDGTMLPPFYPGRMALVTALAAVLVGAALLLLLLARGRNANLFAQGMAILELLTVLPSVVVYTLTVAGDPAVAHVAVAMPTTVALTALGLAIVLARPTSPLLGPLATASLAGTMARRMLVAAVVIPIALAWIRLIGERHEWYSTAAGAGIMVAGTIFCVGASVIILTKRLVTLEAERAAERERSAEQGRVAAAYARSLLEASLDPLVTISREGKITDVNAATERATGRQRMELIGSDFCDYFIEPEKARAGYQRVFAEGAVRDYALAIRSRTGERIDVLYNATLYRDPAGEVAGVFAAARDITLQKEAWEYARSLLEASLDPLVTISAQGRITDVNEATVRVTGVARERLIGTEFSDYFTEPQKAQQGYRDVFAKGYVKDFPLTIRDRDGRLTNVLYNATVYQDARGEVRGVFAAARDVTAQERAEQVLRESEERYRSLTIATAQVVWSTGPDGQVDDMPMWRQLTGQSQEEVRGWGWLNAVHPDDRQLAQEVWSESIRTHSLYAVEYRVRRHDGKYIYLAVRGVPVTNADGSLREWIGTCSDITERVQADQEIRRLNAGLEQRVTQRTAQLEAANKELEAFTYSVAHDLRAPLRHVDGFARLLAEDNRARLDDTSVSYLDHILRGTAQMGRLIDDLLNLSRVGRQELRPEIVGLGRVVDEVIESLRAETGERRVEWKVGPLPFLECDALLVHQVFQNLLSNAVKFTRPRDPAVIEIGQRENDGEMAVFVRDNGVGFNMKYADKLFGVFQRLHRQEDFEGTGVGLVTVHRIVQKHGGRIWAEAALDHGATFYFTLQQPAREAEPPAASDRTEELLGGKR